MLHKILHYDSLLYLAPESFDSRNKWKQCESIRTIWDQSNCGSCWAVASAAAISDRICIHKNIHKMVSAEQLMDCANLFGTGCHGGLTWAAMNFWRDSGVISGGVYGETDTCQPYSMPRCSHHTKGCYPPCPKEIRSAPTCKYLL